MLFVIHALDAAGARREPFYPEHRAHQDNGAAFGVEIVMGGPLVGDDGQTAVGSLIVVEAKDRAAGKAFTDSDPYHLNGVWDAVEIHAYHKKRG